MDSIIKVHRKYQELIGKPNEYHVCELADRHMLNINFYKNQLKQCIDKFLGHYATAYRILEPRMRSQRHLVQVAKIGGLVELKEPGFEKTYRNWRKEVDAAIQSYNFIVELENSIAAEYDAIENEKTDRLRGEFLLSHLLNSPVSVGTGEQLKMNF